MTFFDTLWNNISDTSGVEWFAVATGILYVVFAARKQMICWLFALLSSLAFVYLCFSFQLYIETLLQCFYVVMAVVGWMLWRIEAKAKENHAKEIRVWSWRSHALNIALSGIATLLIGYFFDNFTNQQNPYMDAFTTCFSLVATYMVTRKVLENWIYWIVIDVVSIFLYAQRGLALSATLYVVFTVLAALGFLNWYRLYKRETV